MTAYYNDTDPYAAEWLHNLIAAGHIAPGDVDTRSIEDVSPDDLRGYDQCHFFAGVGVWSLALRRAGWPDDREIWTGSCPCQPFSAAGKGGGFADERHLWPAFFHLIGERRPRRVLGEQVASKDGLAWLDLVQADLEGAGYAAGAVDLCAAGVGAPHIRQRLWWVGKRMEHASSVGRIEWGPEPGGRSALSGRGLGRLDDDDNARPQGHAGHGDRFGGRAGSAGSAPEAVVSGGLADDRRMRLDAGFARDCGNEEGSRGEFRPSTPRRSGPGGVALTDDAKRRPDAAGGHDRDGAHAGRPEGAGHAKGRLDDGGPADPSGLGSGAGLRDHGSAGLGRAVIGHNSGALRPGPVNGLWGDADWLFCRDGKWRPVEPGTFPLAHGAPARVGRLRAYGNAIVEQAAEEFIRAALADELALDVRLTDSYVLATDLDIMEMFA